MNPRLIKLSAVAIIVAAAALPAFGQRSYDDRIDIAVLLTEAARNFDTAQDVVILSDGQTVTRYADGRFATTVHRILWINSYLAVDEYGDVRVPFDKDHCNFVPLAVRTWRDGQWWPSDSSGVVETLPFELEHAYDYAGVRETMLLLSGMGVPCIMEIAYQIEDKAPFRTGHEGIWMFARPDPAVQSWFELSAPAGTVFGVSLSAESAAPVKSTDAQTGLEKTRWTMTNLKAQPDPHAADLAADSPHLTWSTWTNWRGLGKVVATPFGADLPPASPLRAVADSLTGQARTVGEKIKLIADFVNDRVTFADYSEDYWWNSPREADRIYGSAYAHRLDRAVLAAALYGIAGFQAEPLLVSKSPAPVRTDVASLARFGGLSLRIQGEGVSAVYDPSDGAISRGNAALSGHTIWLPAVDEAPHLVEPVKGTLDVRVDLKFDNKKSHWIGSGMFAADGGLCPFGQMAGLDGSGKEYVGSVLDGLIEGAGVDDYSPERFDEAGVAVGFSVTLDSVKLDDFKRTVLSIGEPAGGIIEHLPSQAELFRKEMRSTIHLPFLMSQKVECRIDTAGHKLVYRPEDVSLKNAAGTFSVMTRIENGRLVTVRELRLEKTVYLPAEWPALRELLLAETQPGSGRIILKTDGDEK